MKKIKYKVTGGFGDSDEGDIVDAYVLIEDNGVALVYHPKTSPGTCASLAFCIEDVMDSNIWVSADQNIIKGGDDLAYINIDSQRELNKLAKNASALKYRNKTQGQVTVRPEVFKLTPRKK